MDLRRYHSFGPQRTPHSLPESRVPRIVLAEIVSAHGIRGDVVVRAFTDDPADIAAYGPLTDVAAKRSFTVSSLRVTAKGVVVHFKGIDDRSAAEALRGLELYIDRSALPPPEDGAYYHVDLIGLAAVDPGGTTFGTVIAVQNFGAGEMLEIQRDAAPGTEYVPFSDTFVPIVDIAAGRVTVIMPEMVGEPEPRDETS